VGLYESITRTEIEPLIKQSNPLAEQSRAIRSQVNGEIYSNLSALNDETPQKRYANAKSR